MMETIPLISVDFTKALLAIIFGPSYNFAVH